MPSPRPLALALTVAAALAAAPAAHAASAGDIDARVDIALNRLLADSVTAQALAERALAVLVFPQIVKAGFGIGGQYGEGALRQNDATVGYYSIASASFGFQAGAQAYAEAIFFMTPGVARLSPPLEGLRDRRRRQRRRGEPGGGGRRHLDHAPAADRRLRLRPAGPDGRRHHRGLEDQPDPPEVAPIRTSRARIND